MGKYGEIQADFYQERTRILDALAQEENEYVIMRLIGALAFRTHCPEFGYIQDALGRVFTDIDFASYRKFFKEITRLMAELGYEEDKMVTRLFGEYRLLFHDPIYERHIDVMFDKLDFSHVIPLKGRLEADTPTLPLAELFLEKMQIVQINEKDLIDTIMLLREHSIGDNDNEVINCNVVCSLCASDWGLWRTVTGNLKLVAQHMEEYSQLNQEDRQIVGERISELEERITAYPKTIAWKLRDKIGERVKWYKDVEELANR